MREKPKDRLKRQEVRRPRSQGSTRAQRGRQNCADPPRKRMLPETAAAGRWRQTKLYCSLDLPNLHSVCRLSRALLSEISSILERHAALSTEP